MLNYITNTVKSGPALFERSLSYSFTNRDGSEACKVAELSYG